MFKVSKVFLPLVGLSFLVGCSSDDPQTIVEDILDKNSVLLSNLSAHAVTYEDTVSKVSHTDIYCGANELRDATSAANGTWSVNSNVLITIPLVGTAYNLTTNDVAGTLVKGTEVYKTDKVDEFTVTKISEELSCLVPAK